jgi:hypothetical protein
LLEIVAIRTDVLKRWFDAADIKTLGITVPLPLSGRADELIE